MDDGVQIAQTSPSGIRASNVARSLLLYIETRSHPLIPSLLFHTLPHESCIEVSAVWWPGLRKIEIEGKRGVVWGVGEYVRWTAGLGLGRNAGKELAIAGAFNCAI